MVSWDTLFEQATEDVSSYSWAIDAWQDIPDEYSSDYLLLLLLVQRNRSKMVLAILEEAPADLSTFKDKLLSLFQTSESQLGKLIDENRTEIQSLLATVFPGRTKDLTGMLKSITTTVQNGFLYKSDEPDDLWEQCHDFLIRWQELSTGLNELNSEPWRNTFNILSFDKACFAVENQFKELFDYFYPLTDILNQLKVESYDTTLWWLNRIPEKNNIRLESFDEKELANLKTVFEPHPLAAATDCNYTEQTRSYALGKLGLVQLGSAREHLLSCSECFGLYLGTRSGIDLSVHLLPEHVHVAGQVTDIEKKVQKTKVGKQGLLPTLLTAVKDFLNNINLTPPRYASALAVACLCIVTVFHLSTGDKNQPIPLTATMADFYVLGGKTIITRGGDEKIEKIKIKQGDVLNSGDPFYIEFRLDQDAYTYVISIDSKGQVAELYSGKVKADHTVQIPEQGGPFRLDSNTGTEFIYLLIAREPIENFSDILTTLTGKSEDSIKQILPNVTIYSSHFLHR